MLAVGSMLIVGIGASGAFADGVPSPDSTIVRGGADWYTQAYENTADGDYTVPEQSDVTGPQRAPFGTGSHKMTIGQYAVQTELYRTDDYDGVKLSDLTRLEYSTFERNTAGGEDRQPTYLRLTVDSDGTGGADTSLFFFPANNGTVVNGEWQNWDVTGTGSLLNEGGDSGQGEMSLAQYVADHPEATLANNRYDADHDGGSISLITGAANTQTRGEYFVDRVIIGNAGQDTLFDFGPNAETDGGTTHLTVDASNLQGWVHRAVDGNTGNPLSTDQEFVSGPATPPAGGGSLKFSLSDDTNPNRIEQFRTAAYDSTFLRDLRTLDFSTFQRPTGSNVTPQQPIYLLLNLDDNGDGTRDHTLYFFPGNNADQHALAQSSWQNWDAADGNWNVDGDSGPFDTVTLANYVVAHPDAEIVHTGTGGGVAFTVGAGGDSQSNGEYFLDDITIGKVDAATGSTNSSKEFDLEPAQPTVSVGDASVSEGNHGATLTFPVTVANPTAKAVVVHYATSDGTATAGSDYTDTSGDLTIPANTTSGQITVPVLSDKVREADETLTVTLQPAGYGSVADGSATGTIVNDDTHVALGLRNVDGDFVRATVSTLPAAAGAPVKVFQVKPSGRKVVLDADLNRQGRISRVLEKEFEPGTKVTFVAKVVTDNGTYTSKQKSITVR